MVFFRCIQGQRFLPTKLTTDTELIVLAVHVTEHLLSFLMAKMTDTTEPELMSITDAAQHH